MKLKSLRLLNFGQHEEFTCNFSAGLNGIVGPNGSGKSNILEAIKYAITGTTTYPLDNYIRIGSTGECSVMLEFTDETGSDQYRIVRKFNAPRTAILTTPTETIRGATNIARYLQEDFGLDFDLVKAIQIVSQDAWVSLFKLPASARITLLQHIFSCDFLKAKRETLRQFLSKVQTSSGIEDTIKAYREMLEEKTKFLEAFSDIPSLDVVSDQYFAAKQNLDRLQEEYNSRTYYDHAVSELDKIRKYLDNNPVPQEDYRSSLSAVDSERSRASTIVHDRKQDLADARVMRELLDKLKPLQDRGAKYQKELDDWHQRNTDARDRYTEAKLRLDDLRDRINTLVDTSETKTTECPICGRDITPAERNLSIARLSEQRASYIRIVEGMEEANNAACAIGRKTRDVAEAIDSIVDETTIPVCFSRVYQDLKPATYVTRFYKTTGEYSDFSEDYFEHVTIIRGIVDNLEHNAEHALATEPARLEQLNQEYDDLVAKYEAKQRLIFNIELATKKKDEYEAYLAKYPDLRGGAAELKGDLETAKAEVDRLQNLRVDAYAKDNALRDIATLNDKIKKAEEQAVISDKLIDRKQALENVVSLLSPDKFPRAVVLGWLRILESGINSYLGAFNAPFTAAVQNDTDIHCTFPDKTVPSWALSGGQQVMLAIAWRLALHNTFATSEACGFITLDEPTTFLDNDNIDNLIRVMWDIKRIANTSNLQILVITHEELLSPLFDSVINL